MRPAFIRAAVTALACFVYAAVDTAFAEDGIKESVSYGVDHYGAGAGECCPECSDLSHARDDATGVRNAFNGIGYNENFAFLDTLARGHDFTDWAKVPGGHDAAYQSTDYADAVFYAGHGISDCRAGQVPPHTVITMGTSTWGTCDPSSRDHMLWGNVDAGGDANVVLFAACQTMQRCMWQGGGHWAMAGAETSVINGYHGDSWDSADNTERYWLYVGNSNTSGLGDNWVDILSITYPFRDDQCATSVVFGATPELRRDQYHHGGFNDLHDPGWHAGSTYFYTCGCDPDEGVGLPGC